MKKCVKFFKTKINKKPSTFCFKVSDKKARTKNWTKTRKKQHNKMQKQIKEKKANDKRKNKQKRRKPSGYIHTQWRGCIIQCVK